MRDRVNIVVFAGAGASKAVNAKQFPTTIEFFERIPEAIKSSYLFDATVQAIREELAQDIIDIEHVLWNLQELDKFFTAMSQKQGVLAKMLTTYNITGNIQNGHNIGHLQQSSQFVSRDIRKLMSKINEMVFSLYGYQSDETELSKNWIALLSVLRERASTIDVFTTNYDSNIEIALDAVYGPGQDVQFLGLKGKRHKTIDLARWTDADRPSDILLTKLHGSVDWKIDGKNIYVGDPVFTGNHDKQGIIYPGFKGESTIGFFDAFHGYLERKISEADVIVFVGFAFRDEHINATLRSGLERGSRVLVINPDKAVKFPSSRASVKFERSPFDENSVAVVRKFVL